MSSHLIPIANPFRPGAGHRPPYLAGRDFEIEEFKRLLRQSVILENLVLTGLRGVGKTVLMDTLKPNAIQAGWLWVGTDLSEAASLSESNIATRLLADLSVITSSLTIGSEPVRDLGFTTRNDEVEVRLSYENLSYFFESTPGLVADKLKAVMEMVWGLLSAQNSRGVIFAYDEAQNLSDHAKKEELPLSLLLDVFQSIQRKNIPMMLLLTGLPTLFPKLVEARTFAERMFRVVTLSRLSPPDSRDAILKPIAKGKSPVKFDEPSIESIIEVSGGYPYFIQFICREVYDVFIQKTDGGEDASVPVNAIIRKLDTDFFSGRWARATDRQRDILIVAAHLPRSDSEFTVQEIVEKSSELLKKPFSASHATQMLTSLAEAGLVYKNRHGRYLFAVPLLGNFILRQLKET
ncbi:MAG: ATP-binding protein [Fibrobacterota bacterium]|nr:ATP-binding protein [Fibrobacterota bacterium]